MLHAFLASALDGGEWSASRPGLFTPGEKSLVLVRQGDWVGPQSQTGRIGKEENSQPLSEIEPRS